MSANQGRAAPAAPGRGRSCVHFAGCPGVKALKVARSLLSVAIGFALFVGALQLIPWVAEQTGFDGTGMSYMMMSIVWTIVAAMICGFVTAVVAGTHEMPHASGLGLLMIGLSFASMQQESISRPTWYQTAIAGCGPISAMVGAAIRMFLRLRRVRATGN